jgi:hypothetical protein
MSSGNFLSTEKIHKNGTSSGGCAKTCFLHSDAPCVRLRAFVLLCQVGRSLLLAGRALSMDTGK